jgi:hypothetical protein
MLSSVPPLPLPLFMIVFRFWHSRHLKEKGAGQQHLMQMLQEGDEPPVKALSNLQLHNPRAGANKTRSSLVSEMFAPLSPTLQVKLAITRAKTDQESQRIAAKQARPAFKILEDTQVAIDKIFRLKTMTRMSTISCSILRAPKTLLSSHPVPKVINWPGLARRPPRPDRSNREKTSLKFCAFCLRMPDFFQKLQVQETDQNILNMATPKF